MHRSRQRIGWLMTMIAALSIPALALQSSLPGVVVERVVKNSAADRAGLREADTILTWVREGDQGRIDSPFELAAVEMEQAPRGPVILRGLRDQQTSTWTLNPTDSWGVEVRPQFSGKLLDLYEQSMKAENADVAAERWQAAVVEAQQSQRSWLALWFMARRARLLAYQQQWEEADLAYKNAVQQASTVHPAVEAQLLRDWAGTFLARDINRAAELYQQALVKNRQLAPQSMAAAANLSSLGRLAQGRGDLDGAEKDYREVLAIRETIAPDSLAVAWVLGNLSTVETERGALTQSDAHLQRALKIKQTIVPGTIDIAKTLEKLATLELTRGDLREAEEHFQATRAILEKLEADSEDLAEILNTSGGVPMARGDWSGAKRLFRDALEVMRKANPQSQYIPDFLNNLGAAEIAEGNLGKAEEYLKEALNLLPPGQTSGTLNNLGAVARGQGNLVKAEQYYLLSLKVEEQRAPDSPVMAEILFGLGEIARLRKDYAKAERYHRKALIISQGFGAGASTDSLVALGTIMRATGRLAASADFFDQALHAMENQVSLLGGNEETRSTFRANHSDFYREYIDVLVRQNKPEVAFQVLEHSRARTLLELLTEAHIDIRKGVDPVLLEQQRSYEAEFTAKTDRRIRLLSDPRHTSEQLAQVEQEIDKLESQIKDLREQIRVRSPNYAALTQAQVLGLKEIQQQVLDPDTLLLAYSLGPERSYVFAVTQDALKVYRLPGRATLEVLARNAYRRELSVNNPAAGRKDTDALSQMLFKPLAKHLSKKRLAIIADGALQYIPFAALQTPSGMLLGAQHEIVYVPSASSVAVLRKEVVGRTPASKLVAVLADPVFDAHDERIKQASAEVGKGKGQSALASQPVALPANPSRRMNNDQDARSGPARFAADASVKFPRLFSTRREAEDILAMIPAEKGLKALDFDASRSTATDPRLSEYQTVHFATHALIDNRRPALSGIVLSMVDSQGEPQNGFLGLEDIYNLNLSANLVVLSACETGLRKDAQAEGISGLTRGFMFAGVPRLAVSLWRVPDRATAELMKQFYRGMLIENLPPTAAMSRAQMKLAQDKRWSAPYYWAGFTLQGDWK